MTVSVIVEFRHPEQAMNKCSPEFLSLADDCLRQFAQTVNYALSTILSTDDLDAFQASYQGFRVRYTHLSNDSRPRECCVAFFLETV